ncbi:MAG: hypothetical protein HYS07_00050 [Chlamydiae bacterium]|nr:hypothetical protein [Chlamydiota bacterium]MBI3276299.1 hypothetical protein [Chlamydiota bacterium]
MKTSLIIEDRLFRAAQKEAHREGKTLSETISFWARVGWESLRRSKHHPRHPVKPVDLGGPSSINLKSRRDWMDLLDHDRA